MDRTEFGYYIDILVNDVEVPELRIEAVHDAGINDKRTLNCCARIAVKDGDKITAKLISRANGEDKKGKYSIDSTISVERVALF